MSKNLSEEDVRNHQAIRDTQLKKALEQFICKAYYRIISQNPKDYIPRIHGDEDTLCNYIDREYKQTLCPYAFITVSFPPDIFSNNISAIVLSVERRPKFVKRMAYVFEYHTSGENHPHAHILVELDRTVSKNAIYKSTLIQRYRDKFRFIELKSQNIDVRMRTTYENTLKYISGVKMSSDKQSYVVQDAKWRKDLGLPEPYLSEFSTPES